MALLEPMPAIMPDPSVLQRWGKSWLKAKAFGRDEHFGAEFDKLLGAALATMLGGVKVTTPSQDDLAPKEDAVEVGPVRVVGGIRPQNYDVGYRPDGARFVHDTKTLNDTKSVGKNFQNMVNDLGTEATTVHMRFPFAVVSFLVVIPSPCFTGAVRRRFTRMLERLVGRHSPIDLPHKAEALSLVLWEPKTGVIDPDWPEKDNPLRLERFSQHIEREYRDRYDRMPPHDKPSAEQKRKLAAAGEDIPEPDDEA